MPAMAVGRSSRLLMPAHARGRPCSPYLQRLRNETGSLQNVTERDGGGIIGSGGGSRQGGTRTGEGDHAAMDQQPAAQRGRPAGERLLFTPPARLGWTFRSRRALITPYGEPPPDPEVIRQQAATRLTAATTSWQRARKWGIRPSLIILV